MIVSLGAIWREIWPSEVDAEISARDYNCADEEGPTHTRKVLLTKRLTLATDLLQFKLFPKCATLVGSKAKNQFAWIDSWLSIQAKCCTLETIWKPMLVSWWARLSLYVSVPNRIEISAPTYKGHISPIQLRLTQSWAPRISTRKELSYAGTPGIIMQ